MIRGNLSDISSIDLIYIMHRHKKDYKLYDVQFREVADEIKAFIKSVMINGYHDEKTQSILNNGLTNNNLKKG